MTTVPVAARDYTQFPQEHRRYWEALGRFTHTFTAVERLAALVLWRMSGTTFPISQAIFSGVRIDSAISLIYRVITAQRANGFVLDDAELQDAFSHLQPINALRNDIVHYGVHESDDRPPSATNIIHAITSDRIRETAVNADTLDLMTSDAQKIASILTFYFMREAMVADALEQMTRERRKQPWLYTPLQRSPDPNKTRKRAPKQPHQRRS